MDLIRYKFMSKSLPKVLAIIGGLVVVIFAVLSMINLLGIVLDVAFWPTIWGYSINGWVNAIIALIVGILILISTGTIKSSTKVTFNGVTILVLGILAFVFGDNLGAILVIIGGILLLI